MTVTVALQLRFGNHCGLFWVVKRFFQQRTILKRTVKLNVSNGLLNKLYVRWFMKVLAIGLMLCH